jgi:hypothetical protein
MKKLLLGISIGLFVELFSTFVIYAIFSHIQTGNVDSGPFVFQYPLGFLILLSFYFIWTKQSYKIILGTFIGFALFFGSFYILALSAGGF